MCLYSLSTRMHNRLLHALHILHALGARIRQPRLLLHRQGIDVSAQQEGLAVSVLQHRCEAMAADVRMDFKVVEGFKMPGDGCCGLLFAKGELGVRVEPFICLG